MNEGTLKPPTVALLLAAREATGAAALEGPLRAWHDAGSPDAPLTREELEAKCASLAERLGALLHAQIVSEREYREQTARAVSKEALLADASAAVGYLPCRPRIRGMDYSGLAEAVRRLRDRAENAEATLRAEADGNAGIRFRNGARDDEGMAEFVARLRRERDEAVATAANAYRQGWELERKLHEASGDLATLDGFDSVAAMASLKAEVNRLGADVNALRANLGDCYTERNALQDDLTTARNERDVAREELAAQLHAKRAAVAEQEGEG